MPPPTPAAQALSAVRRFRLKEIRAPSIKVLSPYRAPIPKSAQSSATADEAKIKVHGQPNPFLPRFNTKTNRWAPAKYSLRQQAELIKKAKASNTIHLLPAGPKLALSDIQKHIAESPPPPKLLRGQPWAQKKAVVWEGEPKPKVAGADIGNRLYAGKKRMFKGHKWERTMEKRQGRRKMLLKDMTKRIIRYKGVSGLPDLTFLCSGGVLTVVVFLSFI